MLQWLLQRYLKNIMTVNSDDTYVDTEDAFGSMTNGPKIREGALSPFGGGAVSPSNTKFCFDEW